MLNYYFEDFGKPAIDGENIDLKVNQALLKINPRDPTLNFFVNPHVCYDCHYRRPVETNGSYVLDTKYYWSLAMSSRNVNYLSPSEASSETCHIENFNPGQFGVYQLMVNTNGTCHINTMKEPVFQYLAIIFAILFYLVVFAIWKVVKMISRSARCAPFCNRQAIIQEPSKRPRLKSLDAFRGITIALMILVNHGGGQYWFLQHSVWNGLYIADIIFPWFIWIMGVCIPMGLKSQLDKAVPKPRILARILKRTVKLFFIGIVLNSIGKHFQLETYRIPGVLQRIALSYFFTASIATICTPATPYRYFSRSGVKRFADVLILIPQWFIHLFIVAGYLAIMYVLSSPGCPLGYVGAGGLSLFVNNTPQADCIGGITRYADIKVLGNNHMYQNPTAKTIYQSSSFDPEGILGVLPSIFNAFLGLQAGQTLVTFQQPKSRFIRWSVWSLVILIIGLGLSGGNFMGGPLPVNKNLWSLSFVLVSSSFGFMLLTFCYAVVDVFKIWNADPFYQTGMNSILLFVGHFFTYVAFPWHFKYGKMNTHLMLLFETLFGTTIWILTAVYLHRKKIFFTV